MTIRDRLVIHFISQYGLRMKGAFPVKTDIIFSVGRFEADVTFLRLLLQSKMFYKSFDKPLPSNYDQSITEKGGGPVE